MPPGHYSWHSGGYPQYQLPILHPTYRPQRPILSPSTLRPPVLTTNQCHFRGTFIARCWAPLVMAQRHSISQTVIISSNNKNSNKFFPDFNNHNDDNNDGDELTISAVTSVKQTSHFHQLTRWHFNLQLSMQIPFPATNITHFPRLKVQISTTYLTQHDILISTFDALSFWIQNTSMPRVWQKYVIITIIIKRIYTQRLKAEVTRRRSFNQSNKCVFSCALNCS